MTLPKPITELSKLFQPNNNWLERQQSTILSAAAVITVAYILSSLSGLARQRLLIDAYFNTPQSQAAYEAYVLAFQLPDTIFQLLIIGALSAAFIPIFTTYRKKDIETAFTMSSIMMNVMLLIFVVLSGIVYIFAEPIMHTRTGHQFTPEQIDIAIKLTRVMLMAQFFFAISNFLTGILQSFQRFIIPSIAPILYNVGIVLGVWLLAPSMGIYAAGVGVIIGAFLHMAVQLPLVLKLGFRYKLSFNLKYDGIKEFFSLMPPRMLALSISELRKLALGFFATSLPMLSLVVMQLALQLMTIPIRFFGVPISQASLPLLSEESDEFDRERFKSLVMQLLHQISFFTMPMSVLILILRVPIVRLVFGTANFPWTTTLLTSRVLAILAISITAQSLVHLMLRAFYALKNTNLPFIIAAVDMVIYLIVGYYFVFYTTWGVLGLAIVTSFTAFVEFLLFLFLLDRAVSGFAQKAFWIPQIKMIAASFLMAVFIYLPFKIFDQLIFDTSRTIELIGLTITTSTIGILVYFYFAALFNVHELDIVVQLMGKFGSWRVPLRKTDEVLVDAGMDGDEL